jgi:hypothetical protein
MCHHYTISSSIGPSRIGESFPIVVVGNNPSKSDLESIHFFRLSHTGVILLATVFMLKELTIKVRQGVRD